MDDMTLRIESGDFLLAFKVESMINYNLYLERVEELKQKIISSPKSEGVKELFFAGEIEYNTEEEIVLMDYKHPGRYGKSKKTIGLNYECSRGDDLSESNSKSQAP